MALKCKFWGFYAYLSPLEDKNNFLRTSRFDERQKPQLNSHVHDGPSFGNHKRGNNENRIFNNNHKMNIALPSFQEAFTQCLVDIKN